MDSLLDEVDSLLAPGLSTESPEWCNNCHSLRQEMKRLEEEQVQNFGKLKQKIISTDLLIKKYKSKCDDYDFQCKRTEEASKRADKFQRQCEILETQLKAALLDTEPLRKTKVSLEAEIRLKNAEIQSMSDRVVAAEGAQRQYEHLSKTSSSDIEKLEADKKDLTAKIKVLESGKLTKGAAKEYKVEISTLKKEKAAMLKHEKKLESKLSTALAKIEHLTNILKEKKLSPRHQTRLASGSSPIKSPGRSPRSDYKSSPRRRTRTVSERSSSSQNKDMISVEEKHASENESSSDDSDDNGSVHSIAWTFSPMLKCLSPLPPSPACFNERKLKRDHSMDIDGEDDKEGEVSDIADELEQQLLQENPAEETNTSNDTTADHIVDRPNNKAKDEDDKVKVDYKETENTTEHIEVDIGAEVLEKDNLRSKETEDQSLSTDIENVIIEENPNHPDNVKLVKDMIVAESVVKDKTDTKLSVREKLAKSVEIVSPTAVRKKTPHKTDNAKHGLRNSDTIESKTVNQGDSKTVMKTGNYKERTPPIKRSVCVKSIEEDEISKTDNTVTKENEEKTPLLKTEKSELNRNNTEEFIPMANENLDTIVGSDLSTKTESTNVSVSKTKCSAEIKTLVDTTITQSEKSSQDNEKLHEMCLVDKNTEVEKPKSNNDSKQINDSIKSVDVMVKDKEGQDEILSKEYESKDRTKSLEILNDGQSHVLSKEKVPNECSSRQNRVNEGLKKLSEDVGSLIERNNSNDFNKTIDDSLKCTRDTKVDNERRGMLGSNKFIAFQKSSSSLLSNESEEFSYLDGYQVLTRDDKKAQLLSPKIVHKTSAARKNMRRRIRKTCKYRDLDSECYRESKTVTDDNSNADMFAQLSNESVEKVKETSYMRNVSMDENLNQLVTKNSENIIENKQNLKESVKQDSQKTTNFIEKSAVEKHKALPMEVETSSDQQILPVDQKSTAKIAIESQGTTEGTKPCLQDVIISEKRDLKHEHLKCDLFSSKEPKLGECKEENLDKSDSFDTLNESRNSNEGKGIEKATPSRQLSTGFVVNSPSHDKSSSLDSSCAAKNSPRHFQFESHVCETIVEEDTGEVNSQIDDGSNLESHDSSVIYGVEDLFNLGKEMDSESTLPQIKNIKTATKSPCDKNTSNDKTETNKGNLKSNSVTIATLDEELNRPGCSYHYQDSFFQSTSQEVSMITGAVRNDLDRSRKDVSSEEELSLSRSSTPSFASINRATPVSPLSISPFNFLIPVSPLPSSPIKEIDRVSPLSPEQLIDEQTLELDPGETVDNVAKANIVDDAVKDTDVVNHNEGANLQEQNSSVISEDTLKTEPPFNIETESVKVGVDANVDYKPLKEANKCGKNKSKRTRKAETVSNVPKDKSFDVNELDLFPLPVMISPVKTPKGQSKVKLKVIKLNALEQNKQSKEPSNNFDKLDIKKSQSDKLNGPKQFSSKAPDGVLTVKPASSKPLASLDLSKLESKLCKSAVIKSGMSTKLESKAAKKIYIDGKGAFEESNASNTNNTASGVKRLKKENVKSDVISGTRYGNVEEPKEVKSADSIGNPVDVKGGNIEIDGTGDNKVVEECPAGQDNLAFKRKNRVAHKVNIQPLKPKIQLIDAPRLPPLTGKKRRSNENVTKETQEKKPCVESLSKDLQPTPVTTAIKQEDKKKMQSFLKSSDSPESFLTSVSPGPCLDLLYDQLVNTCLECLGRVCIDTLDVVHRTCVSGQYQNLTTQFPFLSDVDKKAVQLIQYLVTEKSADFIVLMRRLWECIFRGTMSTSVVGKMALCRVFTALCSTQGDIELARALFYHLVTCGHLNYTQLIVSVVSVWPEVLRKDPADRPDQVLSHGMTLVLEEIITNTLSSQKTDTNNKILLVLQKMCNWSGVGGNASSVLKILCTRLMTILDVESEDRSSQTELMTAIELLCNHQGWLWTKEHFITRQGLQSAAYKYTAKKILKPISLDYVCAILQLTSRCMNPFVSSIKGREYQVIINKFLLPMLSHKPVNDEVRQCCLETLLELSPLYAPCLNVIQKWFIENRDCLSVELTTKLEELRIQIKQKVGLQCEPFTKL